MGGDERRRREVGQEGGVGEKEKRSLQGGGWVHLSPPPPSGSNRALPHSTRSKGFPSRISAFFPFPASLSSQTPPATSASAKPTPSSASSPSSTRLQARRRRRDGSRTWRRRQCAGKCKRNRNGQKLTTATDSHVTSNHSGRKLTTSDNDIPSYHDGQTLTTTTTLELMMAKNQHKRPNTAEIVIMMPIPAILKDKR